MRLHSHTASTKDGKKCLKGTVTLLKLTFNTKVKGPAQACVFSPEIEISSVTVFPPNLMLPPTVSSCCILSSSSSTVSVNLRSVASVWKEGVSGGEVSVCVCVCVYERRSEGRNVANPSEHIFHTHFIQSNCN